jgi:hypothetical protein
LIAPSMTFTGTDLVTGATTTGVEGVPAPVSPLVEPPPHADNAAATAIARAADDASGYFRRIDMI